jgi:hypothetical protein
MVFLGTKPTAGSIGWGDPRGLKVNFFYFLNERIISIH